MIKKSDILICIDGGRLDRALNSKAFKHLATKGIFFPQTITYAPYTNSAIHALISGSYGNRNGCSSYWHSIKFKKFEFKTLTEYLHNVGYYTHADIPSDLVLPNSGFDEFKVFDESLVDLKQRHSNLIEKIKAKNEDNQSFFLYLHYESIHTGILNPVLKAYDNYSEEYFQNKKLNKKRYDELFKKSEFYLDKIHNPKNIDEATIEFLSDDFYIEKLKYALLSKNSKKADLYFKKLIEQTSPIKNYNKQEAYEAYNLYYLSKNDIKKAVTALKSGQIEIKNDKDGNIGASIGKKSFKDTKIIENFNALIQTIQKEKPNGIKGDFILSSYITSTMGVSYKLMVRG